MSDRPLSRSDLPPGGSRVHLLGVAGAGMRALAEVLVEGGWIVSGSDRDSRSASTLSAVGVNVVPDTDTGHAQESALVVRSSAIPPDHPALSAANRAGVPVIKRSSMLGALVNDRRLAAVAGTHGKTTVTTMLGLALEAAGRDPLVLVGGHVPEWGGNARIGAGPEAVVEADEYDRSFLQLDPTLAIVTSVEPEHLECYEDEQELRSSFALFAGRAVEREGVLVCADDEGARALADRLPSATAYGFDDSADYRLEVIASAADGQRCRLRGRELDLSFDLGATGAHNAQNAAAALLAASRLGVDAEALSGCLGHFRGVERRLQKIASRGGVIVVDDYAHHPTEVRASVAAVRSAWPAARIVAVFQPHLYSRTESMAREFGLELAAADQVLVLPVYAARERPIPGVDSSLVVRDAPGHLRLADADEVTKLVKRARPDTVFLFMGAGDITDTAHRSARELEGHALGV
ncbi:MAG: UDP-N-acetylmuramate--L-alanine ligase [marine benthic group bacterium]|jgi:UDP-N-acetylmuramate--alanine ligase|nr:UDP-N-acetylmuramate--L-alanine ligase [Candidatus Carthagonibacter metallireducens]MCL7964808.1 UDP-N-acetylmuramate--L-alanine ligase [Gemmatimonadota bacterium]MCL7984865.1 UDP-N-acetylmuramate--L-alanine ligase [Gemmatimonadota bacterium]MCL7990379.1 UDP-N-acetylmuramate--L-alanine ligase [Gemmatimonadota bacterium]